jgi:pimeloyl-ACP methyl ester carboxylesterase
MLQDRLFVAELVDEDGAPLSVSTVRMYVGELLGIEIKNPPGGRAVFQIAKTQEPISIEAQADAYKQRITLAPDCEKWTFKMPVFQGTHLVLLVHGINTRALWMSSVGKQLKLAGMKVEPAGYGLYGVIRFLLPIDWLRRQAVERVRIRYNAAVERHHPKRVSVIAHSFGTYVVARLMAKEFNIKWHRVIFCGSVNSSTFPFEQYTSRFTSPILNEVGTKDIWPALAASITWGYGSIGSHGFQGAPLEERWHRGYAHSDFLTASFAKNFWQPFLEHGEIKSADEPEPLPWAIRLLTLLPLRWLILVILLAAGIHFFR